MSQPELSLPASDGDPLDAVGELARAIGAHFVVREVGEVGAGLDRAAEARRLCTRLEQHLHEERHALTRTGDQARRHLDAIAGCMFVLDTVLKSIRELPPRSPEAVQHELEAERRKLIMGRKADLLLELADGMARCTAPKREVRYVASTHADELGTRAIEAWHRELQVHVDRHVAAHASEVIERARAACSDRADAILAPAFRGTSVVPTAPTFAVQTLPLRPPGRRTPLGVLLSSEDAVRSRAAEVAVDRLVALLERESARLVEHCVHYYVDACARIEASLASALDQHAQSATIANARAREAMRNGRQALVHALERIDGWLIRVDELQQRIA